jgi:hypothetical protein
LAGWVKDYFWPPSRRRRLPPLAPRYHEAASVATANERWSALTVWDCCDERAMAGPAGAEASRGEPMEAGAGVELVVGHAGGGRHHVVPPGAVTGVVVPRSSLSDARDIWVVHTNSVPGTFSFPMARSAGRRSADGGRRTCGTRRAPRRRRRPPLPRSAMCDCRHRSFRVVPRRCGDVLGSSHYFGS